MQAYPIDVYDIDGTLTKPGRDLWYLVTRSLSADKDLFDRYVAEWKAESQSGMDPFECSLTMMKKGLNLLNDGVTSETVRREVQRIASDLVDEGLVWKEAIDFVKVRIGGGVAVVFSTTNYHEGAVGFLDALWQKGWIQQAELEKISLSGSRIDWSSRNVVHFNMSSNKVIGLLDVLEIDEEVLKARISFVFGDDPLGNDRGLLEIARYPYVITNETNRHLNLPDRPRLVTWSEVRAMSISELVSLHTGSSEK